MLSLGNPDAITWEKFEHFMLEQYRILQLATQATQATLGL